jgi:hypothetical protein
MAIATCHPDRSGAPAPQSRRLMGSSAASIALHGLAALLIPALAWMPSSGPPVETVSFVRITHITVTRPRPQTHPQPRPEAPHRSTHVILSVATHVELARVQSRHTASPPPVTYREESGAPTVTAAQQVGNGTGTGDPAPQATATPAVRAVASVGGHSAGGYLPFGAEQPNPVLDPGVRKQLDGLGVHVTLVVTVGEDGKTEQVVFDPPLDPRLEKQIESLLADAAWDPAVCGGGISCEGRATIRL